MLLKSVDWLTYSVMGFNPLGQIGKIIHFFIYDSVKIMLLLFFLVAIIGFAQTYLPQKKIKKWNRVWKIRLIEKSNPEWKDLYDEL